MLCEVLAAIGVESRPIKDVLIANPYLQAKRLEFYDVRKNRMIEISKETVKSSIRRSGLQILNPQ